MNSKAAIIGIGNILMSDDGAGIAVLDIIRKKDTGVQIVELATGGINLVHELVKYDSVIIIDAGNFGGQPGDIQVFKPEEVKSLKTVGYSLHDWDLFTSIELSKKMGEAPDIILIVAIQPKSLEPVEGLSEIVSNKIPELAETVINELEKINKS